MFKPNTTEVIMSKLTISKLIMAKPTKNNNG
jgi:hypothetical protein